MCSMTCYTVEVLCLLICCLPLVAGTIDRVDSKAIPGLPEGVSLGMSVKDLMMARPKAEKGGDLLPDQKPRAVDLSKGSHILIENRIDGRVNAAAAYVLKDGRCTMVSTESEYKHDEFLKKREDTVRLLVGLLGNDYEKHLRSQSFAGGNYIVPVLLWKGKERCVELIVPSDYPAVTFDKGSVHVAVWMIGLEPTGYSTYLEKPDQSLIDSLFAPVEKALGKMGKL
jgi:hypothetical protein